jgi:molybdopterin/thiamine biosynthesis adenylyltransferase
MWFDRLAGVLDTRLLSSSTVVVVGTGRMGSRIAWHLARSGVALFLFVDPDVFQDHNVPGHVLDARYVGWPKAPALARAFMSELPWVHAQSVTHRVSNNTTNAQLIALVRDATLVVVATDDLSAQFRVGRVTSALDIPTIFPGLFQEHGGEVFLALGRPLPCFECYSRFRPLDAPLRAVAATSHASLGVEQAAVHIALGVLDPSSRFAEIIAGTADTPPRQLFAVESFAAPHGALFRDGRSFGRATVRRRPRCPGCVASRRLADQLTQPRRPSHAPTPSQSSERQRTRRHWRRSGRLVALMVPIPLLFTLGHHQLSDRPATSPPPASPRPAATTTNASAGHPTIAVVHLTRDQIGPSRLVPSLATGEMGRVAVHAPGAQTPHLHASHGQVGPPVQRDNGWWQWWYIAPSHPGHVTLTLEATFPGASYSADVTPLDFNVR